VQIVLTKKKDLRLLQFGHNIMPFCGGTCASTDTKGESLKGQTLLDPFDVSSGCPLSFLTLQQPRMKKFRPYTDACDMCTENVTLSKNYYS